MGRSRESRVYRVRQLPIHLENCGDVAPLLAGIAPVLGAVDNIRVFSLARNKANSKIATLSFNHTPSIFDNDEEQWTLRAEHICGRNIIFDTHFRGFTVLKEPQHGLHTIDCIAISGLASHPFGSWKRREAGSDFMWLRDRLPQDVPQLRSLIHGYDTTLFKSHSFQNLNDIAWSFNASLREIRRSLPPAKPLILLAHSLGGIVLKQALVLMAHDGDDEYKAILESVKGLVFFGVPHRGMEVSHFLAMVAKQPNEDLISRTLSPDSDLLPKLHEEFSRVTLRINQDIRFVYETVESQTTEASHSTLSTEKLLTFGQQNPNGTWVRSETAYAVLVSEDSAVPRGTLRRNGIAVNEDHSNMVKFGEDDPAYEKIMSFIFDLSCNVASQKNSHLNPVSLVAVQKGVGFSTVPFPRDPGFVGRKEVLAELESEFANPQSQNWASLFGLGGIGKSQIAIEYSYRQKEGSPQISTFWVHASSKARFEQSYAEIATAVQVPGAAEGKSDILQFVSKWLANSDNGPWLLILDNADDASVLLDVSTSKTGISATPVQCCLLDFLPRVQHGAVLITYRDRTCALDLNGYGNTPTEVLSMSLNESVQLLRRRLPDAVEEEALELVKELENVPLAISQASAYIKAVALISIPKYLGIFRRSNEDQAALLNKDKGDLRRDRGIPNAVVTSWELSFSQIRDKTPDSADLLSLMSFLNRQGIPQFLIQGDVNEISFSEAINPLLSFSLIRAEIGEDTFEMHRLVQTAMRHWLRSNDGDQLWKARAIERVAQEFPSSEEAQDQRWPVCEALLSHADEVILHSAGSREFQLYRADILVCTAWYLIERKSYAELAEQRSTEALRIQQQYLDNDSDEILNTMGVLAYAQEELSRTKDATVLKEYILEQRLHKWGPEDRRTFDAMHNLAMSYNRLGRYEKAEDLLSRVIEAEKRSLDPADPRSLISGNSLACVQINQGRYGEAAKCLEKILEMSRKCLGIEHISTLAATRNLSDAYLQQNKPKEAETLIAQAIPLFTNVFGPSHWWTLDAKKLLADTYYNQKKLDEAEEICKSCLLMAQELYGPQHGITLRSKGLLGLIYRVHKKFVDASRLSKDVMESLKHKRGANHPSTLGSMYNLAVCYYDMGKKDQATQLMTEVLCKRREVLNANHPATAESEAWLARWKSMEEESEKRVTEGEGSEGEGSEDEESEEEESEEEERVEEEGEEKGSEVEGSEEVGSEEEESEEGETATDDSMREQLAEHPTSLSTTQETVSEQPQKKRRRLDL